MACYLHRISHCREWSHPLLENNNLLSIGFSDVANPDFLEQHQQHNWEQVATEVADYYEPIWGYRPRSPHSLQKFLQMDEGDTVVIPDWGTFHVYQIASEVRMVPATLPDAFWIDNAELLYLDEGKLCSQDTQEEIDLGFFREVELVERNISRADYADASLTKRLKARQTTLDITDLEINITQSIDRFRANQVINWRSSVLNSCAERVLEVIDEQLNPDKFERLIQAYFCRMGASAEIPPKGETGKKGDADVIATFEALKTIFYVQAKHHEMGSETDSWAVQQIKEYVNTRNESTGVDEYTIVAWVISSAKEFSNDCKIKARNGNVRLINGLEFAKMLLDAGMEEFALL